MEGKSVAQERDQLRDEVERLTAELADEIDESLRLKTEGLRAELAAANERIADLRKHNYITHDLYATGDADAPDAIKDRNGEVVLDLCRNCGRGEAELEQPCDHRERIAALEQDAARYLDLLDSFITQYEDGIPCYDGTDACNGNFIGNAVRLGDVEFKTACEILNEKRPRNAARKEAQA